VLAFRPAEQVPLVASRSRSEADTQGDQLQGQDE